MGKSVDESQRDAAPLPIVERPEATTQRASLGFGIETLDHVRLESASSPSVGSSDRTSRLSLRTASSARKRTMPVSQAAPAPRSGRIGLRILPDADEDLLQHVSRHLRPPHDAQRDAIEPARFQLVQPLQCRTAATRDPPRSGSRWKPDAVACASLMNEARSPLPRDARCRGMRRMSTRLQGYYAPALFLDALCIQASRSRPVDDMKARAGNGQAGRPRQIAREQEPS